MKRRSLVIGILAIVCAGNADADPDRWQRTWQNTNFSLSSISDWAEIRSGGVPKDAIPALDAPVFTSVDQETGLRDREPVITIEIEGANPRAYPVRYLIWHEIVNDTVGATPIAVTFCPLCNSAMVFDRHTAQGTLSFGVSGMLRHSDMVMFDRQTESWWQQALGEAIVGDLTGTQLRTLPAWMESWADFKQAHPDGMVMAQPSGYRREYGRNPYLRYDSQPRPFLYDGEGPPHGLAPLERVIRVGDRAWPLRRLSDTGEVNEAGLTITWRSGQASALDAPHIAEGRDVGSIRVRDARGRDVAHDVMFAFAFHAFWPDGIWMLKD